MLTLVAKHSPCRGFSMLTLVAKHSSASRTDYQRRARDYAMVGGSSTVTSEAKLVAKNRGHGMPLLMALVHAFGWPLWAPLGCRRCDAPCEAEVLQAVAEFGRALHLHCRG